jgi:hypothetical protein
MYFPHAAPPPPTRSLPLRRRDDGAGAGGSGGLVAAVVGYLAGVFGPAIVTAVAIYLSITSRCAPEAVDCTWGLEFLLVIPVLLAGVVAIGPMAAGAAMRSRGYSRSRGTAWRAAVLSPVVLFAPYAVLLVPVVAWAWAQSGGKGHSSAGHGSVPHVAPPASPSPPAGPPPAQFDPDRGTLVRWDPGAGRWLELDRETGEWGPQPGPGRP